ncbi:MAG: hypothetical protein HYY57_02440, partial [Candidatus Omnitrophica bacterium]|nr:hypothetical protein [Candidatus Omnitrophota bacterium]
METPLKIRRRNRIISIFVIFWILLFQYETWRANSLSPLFHRPLPKTPFLFPPAGWIMFFHIGRSYGFAEVYARKDNQWQLLKPHEIFKTRFIGYDNFRRNVLSVALEPRYAASFCRYLFWRLPQYEAFTVAWVEYPDLI